MKTRNIIVKMQEMIDVLEQQVKLDAEIIL